LLQIGHAMHNMTISANAHLFSRMKQQLDVSRIFFPRMLVDLPDWILVHEKNILPWRKGSEKDFSFGLEKPFDTFVAFLCTAFIEKGILPKSLWLPFKHLVGILSKL
jgi:hypothetical protein